MTEEEEWKQINRIHDEGHTLHCAKRQTWGDGECECPGDGTGSPHHTMNPPPGGWPRKPRVETLHNPERLRVCRRDSWFRGTRRHTFLTVGLALGVPSSTVSEWERGLAVATEAQLERMAELYGCTRAAFGGPCPGDDGERPGVVYDLWHAPPVDDGTPPL